MYPLTSSDRLASFSPNGCKLLVFWGSKIRFNILSSHISNFWLFCLSRHVTLVEVSVPLDGASEYSKVWLTQPISSGAKAVSQAQQLSKLRKECVYFQTKTQPTEQVLKRDACIYSNLLSKIFLRACLFRWDPDCCKSRYQGGTCSYSNLESKNVLNYRLL